MARAALARFPARCAARRRCACRLGGRLWHGSPALSAWRRLGRRRGSRLPARLLGWLREDPRRHSVAGNTVDGPGTPGLGRRLVSRRRQGGHRAGYARGRGRRQWAERAGVGPDLSHDGPDFLGLIGCCPRVLPRAERTERLHALGLDQRHRGPVQEPRVDASASGERAGAAAVGQDDCGQAGLGGVQRRNEYRALRRQTAHPHVRHLVHGHLLQHPRGLPPRVSVEARGSPVGPHGPHRHLYLVPAALEPVGRLRLARCHRRSPHAHAHNLEGHLTPQRVDPLHNLGGRAAALGLRFVEGTAPPARLGSSELKSFAAARSGSAGRPLGADRTPAAEASPAGCSREAALNTSDGAHMRPPHVAAPAATVADGRPSSSMGTSRPSYEEYWHLTADRLLSAIFQDLSA
eukprot:scaffold12486_cov112-Isochrysis_galbana.AAC.2